MSKLVVFSIIQLVVPLSTHSMLNPASASINAKPVVSPIAPQDSSVALGSLGALLLLALMWGLSIPVTKLGLESLPPLTLTALRFVIAVPLMMLFARGRTPLPRSALPKVAGLGVLGIGIGQVAQTFGVAGTSASVGTILSATIPMFIVVFAAVRLKQRVSGLQVIGLLTAFAGIALIALGKGSQAGPGSSWDGIAWILLSAVAIAFYYVWSVELTTTYGTATVSAWSTLFGFMVLLPWAAWEMSQTSVQLTGQGAAAAAYLGIVVTVAGLYLWLNLLRAVPARIAAAVQYLQPIVGISASAFLFGDELGATFLIGVGLVLSGLVLTVQTKR